MKDEEGRMASNPSQGRSTAAESPHDHRLGGVGRGTKERTWTSTHCTLVSTGDPERGAALRIEWAVQGIVRFHPNFVNKQTNKSNNILSPTTAIGRRERVKVSVRGLLRSRD